MSNPINRREFTKRSTASAGGILAGSWLGGELLWAAPLDEAGKQLTLLGLNGLARAHEMDYFADGHRAASMVTAHLLCVENQMETEARERISEIFDRNWAGKRLCQPFPDGDPQPERVKEIGEALAERGDTLLQVGHNAIFAMLAIKGFRMMPEAATAERIDGVVELIRSFTPWRDDDPDPEVDPPEFSDSAAASKYVLQEAYDSVDRFVGYGQGFAGHMLTFGQSLVELSAMGDEEWAEACRQAFCKYVTVTRRGPAEDDKRYQDHKPIKDRPVDTSYWQRRPDKAVGIGHVFKYPYSYYDLLRRADDPELAKKWDAQAYHIF